MCCDARLCVKNLPFGKRTERKPKKLYKLQTHINKPASDTIHKACMHWIGKSTMTLQQQKTENEIK